MESHMKPCKSCPFNPDAVRGVWHPAHYLLIAYLGSIKVFIGEFRLETMGCHHWNGALHDPKPGPMPHCGGWIRAGKDSFTMTMLRRLGRLPMDETLEIEDGTPVLSPEDMARLNGLDMSRIPPLDYDPDDGRYASYDAWRDQVVELREKLREDPDYARTFVLPGTPLDINVDDEDAVFEAFGAAAGQKLIEAQERIKARLVQR